MSTILLVAIALGGVQAAWAQAPTEPVVTEATVWPRWFPRILGVQATVIDQGVLPFHSAYRGDKSFTANGDNEISQTYGLYLGSQVTDRWQAYVDVEMFRGGGIGQATGLGGLTNGDVIRSGSVDLSHDPYIARAFLRYLVPLSSDTASVARAMDQIPGLEPVRRIELKLGRLATNDDFDKNRYANNTRTQFLNWSLWNNTAWDFAADTRGFTNGIMVAWVNPTWTLRAGSYMMPTSANGNRLDEELWRARGDNVELTLQLDESWGTIIRVLAFVNQARMGRYRDAVEQAHRRGVTPDIRTNGRPGRIKWGGGLNIEQPLADEGETGIFARLGYNDGATESFAFTEVDRLASAGVQLSGMRWARPKDAIGIAYAVDALSADHRRYLEQGGSGFLLGDGRLTYGLERILEAYYRCHVLPYVDASLDYQFVENPGYNRDRGPAHVLALRLRIAY
jgi:hypothetical protein